MKDRLVSAHDPDVLLAGIKQFGLAPDGSDLRDLAAALTQLRREMREQSITVANTHNLLAECERERDEAGDGAVKALNEVLRLNDALAASEAKVLALTTALKRIASSNAGDMNTPHPDHCAVIAAEALAALQTEGRAE